MIHYFAQVIIADAFCLRARYAIFRLRAGAEKSYAR